MKTKPALLSLVLFVPLLTSWIPARLPVSILEVGSFTLALLCLLHPERPRFSPLLIPLGIAVLCGLLQLAFHRTLSTSNTAHATLAWSAHLALVFAVLQLTRGETFLRYLLYFGFALCVLATLQTFTSPGKVFWLFPVTDPIFLMGPFLYHSHYAAFIELLLPLALFPAIQNPGKRLRYSLMAGAMVASVIASATRGGFLVIVLEIVAILALCSWRESGPALISILLLTGALTAIVGWESLAHRFEEKSYFDFGRAEMLKSSVDMIRDRPWAGVGLGNWPAAYPAYARYDDGLIANQAHNDWAQWTAEGGITLLAAMFWVFALAIRQARRTLLCIGPVFVLLHAGIDYQFQKPQIAALAFTLMAIDTRPPGRRTQSG